MARLSELENFRRREDPRGAKASANSSPASAKADREEIAARVGERLATADDDQERKRAPRRLNKFAAT